MATESAHTPLRQPLYLLCGARSLFGWLYRPPRAQEGAGLGLVICRPFGFEALCSHRSVRAFATAAAEVGVPVLCFDYGGTGDSEDLGQQAEQLEAWTADVLAAVGELQRRTGVRRVCLLGFRLGALLAVRAAERSDAVEALIAVAPVVSGARYLRELRMTVLAQSAQRAAACAAGALPAAPADPVAQPEPADGGALEVTGYRLSAASIAALAQIDLMQLTRSPVSELLLLDRGDVPTAAPWAGAMARRGARSDYRILPGFAEMMMTTAVYTVVPQKMVRAVREWLSRLQGTWQGRPAAAGIRAAAPVAATCAAPSMPLLLRAEAPAPRVELREHALLFGADPTLFGVLTEPSRLPARAGAIILLNDGANAHIGSNRTAVLLARRWARHGYAVLRMDLAGLGDSDTRAGCPTNQVFPAAAMQDVRAAIELMRARYGPCEITLGGLCSGAYHAYRAAAEGLPVTRLILVNQRDFFWRADLNGNYLRFELAISGPGIYRRRLLSAASWKKLLRGQVQVGQIGGIYLRRARLVAGAAARELGRALHIRLPQDLGFELERIVARGVRPIFIFSRGDAGWRLLQMQAGSALARLGERCRVRIVEGSDHTFTTDQARVRLQQVLGEELSVGAASAGAGEAEGSAELVGGSEPRRVSLSSSV